MEVIGFQNKLVASVTQALSLGGFMGNDASDFILAHPQMKI